MEQGALQGTSVVDDAREEWEEACQRLYVALREWGEARRTCSEAHKRYRNAVTPSGVDSEEPARAA
jgi:hypothetical protein